MGGIGWVGIGTKSCRSRHCYGTSLGNRGWKLDLGLLFVGRLKNYEFRRSLRIARRRHRRECGDGRTLRKWGYFACPSPPFTADIQSIKLSSCVQR